MIRLVPLLLLAALAASACGDAGAPLATPPTTATTVAVPDLPTGGDEVVLRIDSGGGFVPVEFNLVDLSEFTLYGDGTVVTEGVQTAAFPGPAVPALVTLGLTREGVERLAAEALAHGLDAPLDDYGFPGVADAATTVFTLDAGGQERRAAVYALGIGAGGPASEMDEAQEAARARLVALRDLVTDTAAYPAEHVAVPESPYDAQRLMVAARPGFQPDPSLPQDPVDWPLADPSTLGAELPEPFTGFRCFEVSGPDLEVLRPVAAAATALTPWASGGQQWNVVFRPLLPDDPGCSAFAG